MANDKSIFKKLTCSKCKTWETDVTGKSQGQCDKCGTTLVLSASWYCRLTRNGKTSVKAISSRRQDAVDYLHAAKDAIRRNALLPGEEEPITWKEAANDFVAWYESLPSKSSVSFYRSSLRNLERIPVDKDGTKFTDLTLQDIEPKHLATFKANRLEMVSPKTVHSEMGALNRMYTLILETRSVRRYPMLHAAHTDLKKVKPPELDNEKTRFLDKAGIKKLLQSCTEPHTKLIIIIGVKTMLRRANILALRRSQIDLENHQIIIPRKEMKSKKGNRPPHVVPIDTELETLLRKWMIDNQTFDYLFPSPRDPRTHRPRIGPSIDKALLKSGVNDGITNRKEKITFNVATRHSGATLLLEETGDIHSVSKLLDHSNISITDRKYVKKVNEKLHRVVNQLGDKMQLGK